MGVITDSKKADQATEEADAPTQENKASGNELEALPTLLEGTRVQVTDGEYAGRMGVVTDHIFEDTDEYMKWRTPGHPGRAFAKAKAYLVRTRDARNELLEVPADEVKELDVVQGWARGQTPDEEAEEE